VFRPTRWGNFSFAPLVLAALHSSGPSTVPGRPAQLASSWTRASSNRNRGANGWPPSGLHAITLPLASAGPEFGPWSLALGRGDGEPRPETGGETEREITSGASLVGFAGQLAHCACSGVSLGDVVGPRASLCGSRATQTPLPARRGPSEAALPRLAPGDRWAAFVVGGTAAHWRRCRPVLCALCTALCVLRRRASQAVLTQRELYAPCGPSRAVAAHLVSRNRAQARRRGLSSSASEHFLAPSSSASAPEARTDLARQDTQLAARRPRRPDGQTDGPA